MITIVALALLASACGSDGATSSDAQDSESGAPLSRVQPESETQEGSDDAEASFDQAAADEMTEEYDSEGESAPATSTTAPSLSAGSEARAPSVPADGGLFEPSSGQTTADKTEDNTFKDYGVRPFVSTDLDPLSTFALDVDTASYSIAKQWAGEGVIPPEDSVRLEEYVNSFDYDYPAPSEGLALVADGGPSPFDSGNVLVRVGVQAEEVSNSERPMASLTFVVDTSGSMDRSNRLELVKTSLERLVNELDTSDSVALVTYSDNAEVLLPPTSVVDRDDIVAAIRGLRTDGSTNLEAGLQTGYDLANESFVPGGINRVILASDGVANVGLTDPDGLVSLIRGDADRGIQLVTVGVGMGNFNDVTMEQLANDGDGFYAYVNNEAEANKLFSDDLVSTLLTVAIDGKIQVEFDPNAVEQYRLLGFENRAVLDEDFRNDAVDAGELGAGHQVTAIYELTLRDGIDDRDRLGTVQLRWEDPEEGTVRETRLEVTATTLVDTWSETDDDFKLAVTAASLAEILRGSPHSGGITLAQVAEEADGLGSRNGAAVELADLAWELDALT